MGRKKMNVCYHYSKASTIYGALTATCSWHALIQSRQLQGGEPIFPSSEPEPEAQREGLALSHRLEGGRGRNSNQARGLQGTCFHPVLYRAYASATDFSTIILVTYPPKSEKGISHFH